MSYLRSIKKKILNLSSQAGIYQFLNYKGDILYIGKAKNIKKRVSSYTSLSRLSYRIQRMVSQINNIETIITDTEAEALLLESNLIKKFKPKYK